MSEIEAKLIEMGLAWRQRNAFFTAFELIKKLFSFQIPFKSIIATVITIFQCFGNVVSDTPLTPAGEALDLTGYELVFDDEFDGDSLNFDLWEIRTQGPYGRGFYLGDLATVEDGNLIITGKHLNDGIFGTGWYAGSIVTKKQFCQGYFEIRAILNENQSNTRDFWSSFWITCDGVYNADISKGGPGGCEIDIMESHSGNFLLQHNRECVTHAVWCNGYDSDPDTIDGRNMGSYYADKPFTKYNTYGLKWTDTEYIWYINGVETIRSSFPLGVSQVPEDVVLSLSVPIYDITKDESEISQFKVDYLRIYQLAE